MTDIAWGPSGQAVYERTYSRVKPDGERETWPETVERVVRGNLELVYGPQDTWRYSTFREFAQLVEHIESFKLLPAGRHLWASGVKGRQFLMNCWTAGWGGTLAEHFDFTFMRLMEGGGVGSNYSQRFLASYGKPRRTLNVHIVCDPSHADYAEMQATGSLSTEYDAEWDGAFVVEDSREGWAAALTDLIDTYMTDDVVKHENRVYDVSRVRPSGARLKTFGGTASGPPPFATMMHRVSDALNESYLEGYPQVISGLTAMEIDHAIAECVVSGGNRRSARMSIMHWRDPHIFDFIACKQDHSLHWTTNISVEVDDRFFIAFAFGDEHALRVHEMVTKGMLTNGEPGYWNSSLSNEGELEPVYATNPCGEITLQPWEACNLGHVNLDAFADDSDWHALTTAHRLMTRFLIRATYGDINDPKSRKVLDSNRRIGVGHLGVQGYLNKSGIRYSEAPKRSSVRLMLSQVSDAVRSEARDYAFELRIPEPVKVTTVAPTGSVAKLPGVTEGIHPIYSRFFERRIRFSLNDPDQAATVEQARADGLTVEVDGYDDSGKTAIIVYPTKDPLVEAVEARGFDASIVESADELSIDQMLAFQAMYQELYADNAVSFTVNVKPGLLHEQVAETIMQWLPKLKGTTIMVDESRPQSPYTRITEEQYLAASVRTVEDGIDLECATGACPIR